MSSTIVSMQLGMLAVAVMSSVLYANSRQRETARLGRLLPAIIAVYALAHILFIAFLWLNHIAFPLNLESMELTVLEHFKRAVDGRPIYVEPTPEFVALAYNPLYYYFAVPFAWVFGAKLFTLRLVAVLGMFGSEGIIFLAVRRTTGSAWWGLVATGLFAAAYRVMGAYLDNAHTDSWLLFMILLGCYLIDLNRSRTTDLVGVLMTVIAFWFKQPGALFAIGTVLFVTWQEGWQKSWPFWLLAIALGPALYLAAPAWLFGSRFHYYTWEVPRQWTVFNFGTIRRLGGIAVKSFFVLATAGFTASAFALWRSVSNRKISIWYFMFPFALLSGLLGALDSESNNNVFIPMGVWFIITGVLGLKQLTERYEVVERWGVHLFALGASFALFLYNPTSVIVSTQAGAAYQGFVSYLESLDGPVYAPWLGQLPDGHQFYPAVHWVSLTDLVREAGLEGLASLQDDEDIQRLLEPVLYPKGQAYILMTYPLENDIAIAFLTDRYVLDTDLGERFESLSTLPRRYFLGWPRYLYRYAPEEAAAQNMDSP